MHYYKLGYWTYDGAAAIELLHERAFNKHEFRALVYQAVAELMRAEPGRKEHFPFAWLYDQVATRLIEHHGFERLEYTAEFEIYGSGNLLDPDPEFPDVCKLAQYLREQGVL